MQALCGWDASNNIKRYTATTVGDVDTALCQVLVWSQVPDGVKFSYSTDNLSPIRPSIGKVSSGARSNPADLS